MNRSCGLQLYGGTVNEKLFGGALSHKEFLRFCIRNQDNPECVAYLEGAGFGDFLKKAFKVGSKVVRKIAANKAVQGVAKDALGVAAKTALTALGPGGVKKEDVITDLKNIGQRGIRRALGDDPDADEEEEVAEISTPATPMDEMDTDDMEMMLMEKRKRKQSGKKKKRAKRQKRGSGLSYKAYPRMNVFISSSESE